jgi:hypothetical protein
MDDPRREYAKSLLLAQEPPLSLNWLNYMFESDQTSPLGVHYGMPEVQVSIIQAIENGTEVDPRGDDIGAFAGQIVRNFRVCDGVMLRG